MKPGRKPQFRNKKDYKYRSVLFSLALDERLQKYRLSLKMRVSIVEVIRSLLNDSLENAGF